jgi:LDH2 family malate/lactate/ureidoglycolate dehydrogenase
MLASMASPDQFPEGNRWGTALMVLDISRFAPVEDFVKQVDRAVAFVKDTPPMASFDGVQYPGEMEATNRRERLANGIEIEDATWASIIDCATKLGIEGKLGPLP